jgi:preprotein translocase subunit SecG
MQTILTVFHLFLAIGLVGLVLIQHGKGADMGAAFGSGASATVFGARGSASFLSRSTAALAALFYVTSMILAYFSTEQIEVKGLMDQMPEVPAVSVQTKEKVEVPVPSSVDTSGAGVPAVPVPQAPVARGPAPAVVPEAPQPPAAVPEPATAESPQQQPQAKE